MSFSYIVSVAAVAAIAIFVSASTASASSRPHLLTLILDDLGWADLSFRGAAYPTPNLDKLAKESVVLEGYYVQPVCSPTRSSFMTGRFPFHTGLQHQNTIMPGSTAALPLKNPTVPELLKKAGYITSGIGKWHLGYARPANTPSQRGFDTFYGYFQGQVDYYNKTLAHGFDFWRNDEPQYDAAGTYSLDQYMGEAERVVGNYVRTHTTPAEREAEPLAMYFFSQTVHLPLEARAVGDKRCAPFTDKYKHLYCAMMVELDDAVNRLLQLFQQTDLWDNTLLMVSTDNGGMVDWGNQTGSDELHFPASVGCNWPLRGSKGTLYEGGVRGTAWIGGGNGVVPAAVRGTSYAGLAHAVDLPATALAAAGASVPADLIDGHDLRAVAFEGKPASRTEVPINIFDEGSSYSAIVSGDWKLLLSPVFPAIPADGWYYCDNRGHEPGNTSDTMLFNLKEDIEERHDMASARPDIVANLTLRIKSYLNSYVKPQPNQAHPRSLPVFHNHTWKPFLP